jgi:hypothetical protein
MSISIKSNLRTSDELEPLMADAIKCKMSHAFYMPDSIRPYMERYFILVYPPHIALGKIRKDHDADASLYTNKDGVKYRIVFCSESDAKQMNSTLTRQLDLIRVIFSFRKSIYADQEPICLIKVVRRRMKKV